MREPFSQTSPRVGASKPATMRSTVVLPHPDGPSKEKKAPFGTLRETSETARCAANSLVTFRSSKIVLTESAILPHRAGSFYGSPLEPRLGETGSLCLTAKSRPQRRFL